MKTKLIILALCLLMILQVLGGCRNNGKKPSDGGSSAMSEPTESPDQNTGSVLHPEKGQNPSASETPTPSAAAPSYKLVLQQDTATQSVTVPYEMPPVKANVGPYAVKPDLSNIENLEQFGAFTDEQKKMLAENGFVAAPSNEEQLFYIYERNEYLLIPSFITVDSVLQVYHIFFDYSLRTLEQEKLIPALEQLNSSMLAKSIHLYNQLQDQSIKELALKNIAYFGVSQKALELEMPKDLPAEAEKLIQQETDLINSQQGFAPSPLFGFDVDYSQFTPRGHYTRSHDFERFFKAMMWYGQIPFCLYSQDEKGNLVREEKQTVQALLMTYCLFLQDGRTTPDAELWNRIYDPTVFYVGKADDLTILEYRDLLLKAYGSDPNPETFMDPEKLDRLYREAEKLPEPEIQPKWLSVGAPVAKQFRFMGQRYIPDSEILQKLVEPILRPMPTGMDVMGVLGSDRAYEIALDEYRASELWPGYPDAFQNLRNKFSGLPAEKWRSNMYYGWLWTLQSIITPFGEGYPSFMTNSAWVDKSLNTALGSWSELRHDTILYGKQSGAECGGDWPPPVLKSYVEPNVEAYNKLLWLTRYSRSNLTAKGILPEGLQNRMQEFEDLLEFLMNCSIKELRNEELSDEEYHTLLIYGGTLEYLTSHMAEEGMRWFEITSETDKNMAVIADVHTVPGSYLEVGVGSASQIYVVVPVGNKLYLTRGAIFDYYEFVSEERLTDEAWQKMLKEKTNPARPSWTKNYQEGIKEEIPEPIEPFESGC